MGYKFKISKRQITGTALRLWKPIADGDKITIQFKYKKELKRGKGEVAFGQFIDSETGEPDTKTEGLVPLSATLHGIEFIHDCFYEFTYWGMSTSQDGEYKVITCNQLELSNDVDPETGEVKT